MPRLASTCRSYCCLRIVCILDSMSHVGKYSNTSTFGTYEQQPACEGSVVDIRNAPYRQRKTARVLLKDQLTSIVDLDVTGLLVRKQGFEFTSSPP